MNFVKKKTAKMKEKFKKPGTDGNGKNRTFYTVISRNIRAFFSFWVLFREKHRGKTGLENEGNGNFFEFLESVGNSTLRIPAELQ